MQQPLPRGPKQRSFARLRAQGPSTRALAHDQWSRTRTTWHPRGHPAGRQPSPASSCMNPTTSHIMSNYPRGTAACAGPSAASLPRTFKNPRTSPLRPLVVSRADHTRPDGPAQLLGKVRRPHLRVSALEARTHPAAACPAFGAAFAALAPLNRALHEHRAPFTLPRRVRRPRLPGLSMPPRSLKESGESGAEEPLDAPSVSPHPTLHHQQREPTQ
jgi:hypothetical protein